MPNGKGSLECCYCAHWRGDHRGYDGAYEEGFCTYHRSALPSTLSSWKHRICSAFEPDSSYERDSPTISPEERFAGFGKRLDEGILYAFPYNQPSVIEEMKNLSEEA